MKRHVPAAVFIFLAVFTVTSCNRSPDLSKPGGYLLLQDDGTCTLRAVQSAELGTKTIPATSCAETNGTYTAVIPSCGSVHFVPKPPLGATFICENCEQTRAPNANCALRIPQLPLEWQVVKTGK